jgi:hypothetical protein
LRLRQPLAAALLAGAGLLTPAPAARAAGDDLGKLLDGLAAPAGSRPAGEVAVTGWVEGAAGATDLVVRVEPRGAAKLVAEPGVTVTPLPREGVAWPGEPAVRDEAGGGYFAGPVELRLPFTAPGGGPVEAKVEYAYCLVAYQCLFGEAVVRAAAAPACSAAGAVAC